MSSPHYITVRNTKTMPQSGIFFDLKIIFQVDSDGSNSVVDGEDLGIKVADWGTSRIAVDLDNAFLVPGNATLKLFDAKSYLFAKFFQTTGILKNNIRVSLNVSYPDGQSESEQLYGGVVDDSVDYDESDKSITFDVASLNDLLNQTSLIYSSGGAANPLNYNLGAVSPYVKLKTLILDIFKIVNPSTLTPPYLNFSHDWENFYYVNEATDEYDGAFDDVYFKYTDNLFSSGFNWGDSLGEVLRRIGKTYFAMTGMIGSRNAFFNKLFYYDVDNVQEVPKAHRHKIGIKYHLLKYTCAKNGSSTTKEYPNTDSFTNASGEFLQVDYNAMDFRIKKESTYYVTYGGNCYDPATPFDPVHPGMGMDEPYKLSARLWYLHRGRENGLNGRVDSFTFPTIDLDFNKNFAYDGGKYQIIEMTKYHSQLKTDIVALYLGELE